MGIIIEMILIGILISIGLGVYLLGHYLERILIILHEIKKELES